MNNMIFIPYQGMTFQIPSNVKVVVQDAQKNILFEQGLGSYLLKPNVNIAMASHGASLLDVLTNEQYIMTANDGSLGLKFIFTKNPHADASKLMGSIAEALIVQECNNSPEVNRELAKHARGGSRISDKPDNYIAVATGSQLTNMNYPQFYNPSDTQRDIIWVDKNNTNYQLNSIATGTPSTSTKPAGLQVKTSHDYTYVMSNIKKYHYPVVYFDMNNDWNLALNAIQEENNKTNSIVASLVPYDGVLFHLKNRLINYFKIIYSIFNNEITLAKVIEQSKYNGDNILSGVAETAAPDSGSKIIFEVNRTVPSTFNTPVLTQPSTNSNRRDWFDDSWWSDEH